MKENAIWYPFCILPQKLNNISTKQAKGVYVIDENNKKYLDVTSSWWVILHGHSHPFIVEAIKKQADVLCQVGFADCTHNPGIILSNKIIEIINTENAGEKFTKVFFADNGATSVEIALKIAYQYHVNQNNKRKKFVSFEGSYHGETFGAMSIGKSSGFFDLFSDLLIPVDFLPSPFTWKEDIEIENKENIALLEIEKYFLQNHRNIIAFMFEPLVQGAGGMKMIRPEFINKVMQIAKKYNVITIFDEVMTGFGRTGKMFAMHHLDYAPDIVCLSKGMSGGTLPIGATVVNDKIYQAFLGEKPDKILMHGHSYMANPICCAASIASIELFNIENTIANIQEIEKTHNKGLKILAEKFDFVHKIRCLGDIAAFDINLKMGYSNELNSKIRLLAREKGLILRPFENTIYLIPPYCITNAELEWCYNVIAEILGKII